MCIDTSFETTATHTRIHVDVEFSEDQSIEKVVTLVSQLPTPHVIIWYIGCYGLRKEGANFYKKYLLSPLLKQNLDAVFWLVDLTAWGAFRGCNDSINKTSRCCATIEGFSDDRIRCIRSADIFRKMREISDPELIHYFKGSLQREFIKKPSEGFAQIGTPVREAVGEDCEIVADWYDCDVSQAYSAVQYLEGCLIVEEILRRVFQGQQKADQQLVFVLPNDELKYYRDTHSSFQKDVEFLLAKRCEELNIKNLNLSIKFFSFRYGTLVDHRPYNAPGKVIRSRDLSYEDVIDLSAEGAKYARTM